MKQLVKPVRLVLTTVAVSTTDFGKDFFTDPDCVRDHRYETRVFGGPHDQMYCPNKTRKAALASHKAIAARVFCG